MADIQFISPMPVRADTPVDAATPGPLTGESGFDVWQLAAGVQTAPATMLPTPAQDPLAAWLDQQMGFSGQFNAPPGTDPAIEALAAGLPPMPGPELADQADVQIDVQIDDPLSTLLPVDIQNSEVIMIADTAETAPQPIADAAAPVAAEQPDIPASSTPVAPPTRTAAAASVLQQAASPIAAQPAMHSVQVAPAPAGQPAAPSRLGRPVLAPVGHPAAPARPSRPVPAAEGAPVARPVDTTPVDAPPPPIDRAVPDRPAPAMARDLPTAVRSEITLPAGLAETLAEMPFASDPHAPASARATTAAGPGWQAASHDPRPVLQQVTDALVSTRGDRTEIALSPEELGRIRLVMSGPDRGQIIIWAERPETLDLVRRNVDLLTQQLADAGVTAGSLDFRRDDRSGGQAAQGGPAEDDDIPLLATTTRVRMSPTALSDRRLDIRL